MNRNLITRMGTASGVVAALVAAVFAILVNAVRDQRAANQRAAQAERTVSDELRLRALSVQSDLGYRSYLEASDLNGLALVRATPDQVRAIQARLERDSSGDPATMAATRATRASVGTYVAVVSAPPPPRAPGLSPAEALVARRVDASAQRLQGQLDALGAQLESLAAQRRSDAAAKAGTAEALGVGGLLGSALLIGLLTFYLTQYIVVPLRRVRRAARRLADGDLSARVAEEGDAEPVELARSFNTMATSLEHSRAELETQNAELASQQEELERALGDLAAEKRRVEVSNRVGEALSAELEVEPLAETALRELSDAAGAEVGALYAASDEGGAVELVTTRGLDPGPLERGGVPLRGLAGRALAEGRSVVAAHPGTTIEVEAFGTLAPVVHELHVPMRLGERSVGLLSLGRLGNRPFTHEQVDAVERLAGQAAVAFANVLSFRHARRQAQINAAVLDATPDPIGLFAPDGRLMVCNGPMSSLTYEGQIDGPGDDPEREVRDELELEGRTYVRYAAPVVAGAETVGRIVVLRDVTAERESERLKDEFFALVSHELRTPLTSIIGYLELVLDEGDEVSAESRRFLEVVERNAKRLLRLVGDMLFVAQVEAGRLSLERTPVDLALVASESVEAARPHAERAGVALSLEAEPVPSLLADRDRCGQLLDNLISNALKFTPSGGRVTVRVAAHGAEASIEVADTGLGIPAGEQERLFERFFRSSTAVARAVPGVGLGLTIVKTIAEVHGGRVEVTSQEGAGTAFRVLLPLGSGAPSPTGAEASR